jgi:hypothetical protein
MSHLGPESKLVLILLSSPLVVLVIHMLTMRVFRKSSPQKVTFYSCLFGYIPITVLLWWYAGLCTASRSSLLWMVCYSFFVSSSLMYTYFHFFNMSETARRIRILYEIDRAGSISEAELTALYKTTDIISIRMQRLIALNQMKCENGYYSVEGKTLYWAGLVILLWRKILGMEKAPEEGGPIT